MKLIVFTLLVLFAIAQNIDNFVLAVAYGVKNVLIPKYPNVLIAVSSGFATAIATWAGSAFGEKAVENMQWEGTELIGRGLLIMLGVWTLVGCFHKRFFRQIGKESLNLLSGGAPSLGGIPVMIGKSEATIVSTALAIDNLAPSFAFGMRHPGAFFPSVLLLAILTMAFSIVFVACGQSTLQKRRLQFHHRSLDFVPELVSGLLIIGIALLDPGDFAHRLAER